MADPIRILDLVRADFAVGIIMYVTAANTDNLHTHQNISIPLNLRRGQLCYFHLSYACQLCRFHRLNHLSSNL